MARNNASLDIRPEKIPNAGDPWPDILGFLSKNARAIQGYEFARAYGGHDAFVAEWETRFKSDTALPDSVNALLSLVYLIFRRNALSEIFTNIEVHRPIVDACLEKAHKLSR